MQTPSDADFAWANEHAVNQSLRGVWPDAKQPRGDAGARIVFNMSAAYVGDFCESELGYKNVYDSPGRASENRVAVDSALEIALTQRSLPPQKKENIFFGAVEISGSGVRFYGDFCLVLRDRPSEASTLHVLDRNSYDAIRPPFTYDPSTTTPKEISGRLLPWMHDMTQLPDLVLGKARAILAHHARLWTMGQIAATVLDDEDYIEVLYTKRFKVGDLFEVRLDAADAAAEADIANRELRGEPCTLAELEWRDQRRKARRALYRHGIPVRVVVGAGRVKGH